MFALIEWLIQTFGPFLIPPALFTLGLIGYGFLLLINRWR
jgi:hypothetical protein